MSRRIWITVVLIVAIVALVHSAMIRVTTQERTLGWTESHEVRDGAGERPVADLDGRLLTWSTNANVPLHVIWGGEGYGLLELVGFPNFLRPGDITVGREPVRDEWNIAVLDLGPRGALPKVTYLTLNDGTYLHPCPSADGRYVVAARQKGSSQIVGRVSLVDGSREVVSFSRSMDRWPSCSRDGTRVLFQSFRDGNPGGDLYLAVENGAWNTVRLTDSPEVELVWPRIAADGGACVAVERELGEEVGRVVLWEIAGEALGEPFYLTHEPEEVKYPSLDASGGLCCWQGRSEDVWAIFLWTKSEGARAVDPPPAGPEGLYGHVQPSLSADGHFVAFIEDHVEAGADRIGVYDVESAVWRYFDGCGGNVMFPALSEKVHQGVEE